MIVRGNTSPVSHYNREGITKLMLCRYRQHIDTDTGEWSEVVDWVDVDITDVATGPMLRKLRMRPEVQVEGEMHGSTLIASKLEITQPKPADTPPRRAQLARAHD